MKYHDHEIVSINFNNVENESSINFILKSETNTLQKIVLNTIYKCDLNGLRDQNIIFEINFYDTIPERIAVDYEIDLNALDQIEIKKILTIDSSVGLFGYVIYKDHVII